MAIFIYIIYSFVLWMRIKIKFLWIRISIQITDPNPQKIKIRGNTQAGMTIANIYRTILIQNFVCVPLLTIKEKNLNYF